MILVGIVIVIYGSHRTRAFLHDNPEYMVDAKREDSIILETGRVPPGARIRYPVVLQREMYDGKLS